MKPHFLFLDLETTGLDPEKCQVLEIAATATSQDLVELATFHCVLPHDTNELMMNPWCHKQHSESGLLSEVAAEFSEMDMTRSYDGELAKFIRDHTPQNDKLRLAGSSIHFDRSFMVKHLWLSLRELHYRMFDVSSFYETSKWLGIEFPSMPKAHRAMADVKNSLAIARFFRDKMVR